MENDRIDEDESIASPLEQRIGSTDVLSVAPAAIFLPKFENAGDLARENYRTKDCAADRILVANVKSSGSLWLMAGSKHVICSSKNGTIFSLKLGLVFKTNLGGIMNSTNGRCWKRIQRGGALYSYSTFQD